MAKKKPKAKLTTKKSAARKSSASRSRSSSQARPVRRTAKKGVSSARVSVKKVSKALAPGGMWLSPYLTVRDPQAAIDFYQNVFGFKLRNSMPGPDGKIMHAELVHNDCLLMLGPENQQLGYLGPQGISPVTLYTYVEDVDEVTDKASAGGAKIVKAPTNEFWGDRCSVVIDPQGHTWMLATHYKDVAPEDMHP